MLLLLLVLILLLLLLLLLVLLLLLLLLLLLVLILLLLFLLLLLLLTDTLTDDKTVLPANTIPQKLKKIKQFDLSSIVKPLNTTNQETLCLDAFQRILDTESELLIIIVINNYYY